MIAELGGARSGGASDLLFEHLQAARRNLLGSMPGEYSLSLQQAMQSVACFPDKAFRAGIKNRLRSLMDTKAPTAVGPDNGPIGHPVAQTGPHSSAADQPEKTYVAS